MPRIVSPSRRSVFTLLSFALAVCILFSSQLRAQVAGATLSGTVNDPSGAVVPNAQVSARNTATGVARTATTDSAGFYSIPNLLPGAYEVTVTAPGFSTAVQSSIELAVGAQQQLNIPMKPLCRPDCKGLCAQCGADLNLGACACTPPKSDPRWAALSALRGDGHDGASK